MFVASEINSKQYGKIHFFIFLGCTTSLIQAQQVSDVAVIQDGQKLHIQYELIYTSPIEVCLFISENNGNTWNKISQHLSGDVGPKVSGGRKEMVWDVLQARENLVGNSIVFKVKAGSEIKSVKIGNQVWMAENLNVDHYRNGDPIPTRLSNTQWESTTQGAYAIYNVDPTNEKIYGKLYNWYAVNDSRGLCPAGWHVPNHEEWYVLSDFLGEENVAGDKLKSKTLWNSSYSTAANSSGFNALPGGNRRGIVPPDCNRDVSWTYGQIGEFGVWWSSTETEYDNVYFHALHSYTSFFGSNTFDKCRGCSVRCIKD